MRVLKQILLVVLLGLTAVGALDAQNTHRVVGVVKDTTGEPLMGVQVVPVGATASGAVTDLEGNYSVQVPKGINKLSFTFIGLAEQVVDINGRGKIDVTMQESQEVLETVVVTALGIQRKSKTLTYATQSVDSKELTRIKEPNFVNALRGKSAGLQITPNNSGAGGGATKITLRGQTSILGTNQPLIVIDGVPMSSGPSGQAGANIVEGGARDGGDILSTINPDDIASLTVLKGPNAAALYGSSANNGVIIITTKSGREGNVRVDVSTSTSVDLLNDYPELQTTYGAGDGWTTWGGKRISDMTDAEIAAQPYYSRNPRNPIRDFFNVGFSQNTSASINGGTAKAQTYFSYANTYQTGIMPNNTFMRHNLMFKQSYDLWDRLKLDMSINYIHQDAKNRPIIGKALSPMAALYRTPANIDMRYFRHNYEHIGSYADDVVTNPSRHNSRLVGQPIQTWYWYQTTFNNPYWLTNRFSNVNLQDRIIGTLSAKVQLLENLFVQTRTNLDYITGSWEDKKYATTQFSDLALGAQYSIGQSKSTDFFQDALVSYNKELTKKLSLQATAGGSYKRSASENLSVSNNQDTAIFYPNVFLLDNNRRLTTNGDPANTLGASNRWGNNWEAALFATATLGWDDKIFVDGSYRMEWAKSFQQFAKDNEYISFSFYSAGANAQLDKLFDLGSDINNLKLRTSFSVVGNPIPNSNFFAQARNFGTGSVSPAPQPFENPSPETTTSFEVGLDGVMFQNKWDWDLTFYTSTLKNQFLYIGSTPVNTGKIRNWGVEFSTNYRFDITKDLQWRPGFNISFNDNKILETYVQKNGQDFIYATGPQKFQIKYVKGGAYGDIYVNSFLRDENGHIVLAADGNTPLLDTGYKTNVGNATARINFGFNNTFTYKNFQLYFLIDGKIGGKVMSLTQPDMDFAGASVRSAQARDRGYVELPDGSGRRVDPKIYYETIGGFPLEDYVYDATNVRLRDLTLGYTFNDLLGAGKNLQLSLLARNLFFLYRNSPVDPDISQSAGNGFGGIDVYALPTTTTVGLSAKVTF